MSECMFTDAMAEAARLAPDNHSDDLAVVYVGRPEPVRLCGYHATQHLPAVLREVVA